MKFYLKIPVILSIFFAVSLVCTTGHTQNVSPDIQYVPPFVCEIFNRCAVTSARHQSWVENRRNEATSQWMTSEAQDYLHAYGTENETEIEQAFWRWVRVADQRGHRETDFISTSRYFGLSHERYSRGRVLTQVSGTGRFAIQTRPYDATVSASYRFSCNDESPTGQFLIEARKTGPDGAPRISDEFYVTETPTNNYPMPGTVAYSVSHLYFVCQGIHRPYSQTRLSIRPSGTAVTPRENRPVDAGRGETSNSRLTERAAEVSAASSAE